MCTTRDHGVPWIAPYSQRGREKQFNQVARRHRARKRGVHRTLLGKKPGRPRHHPLHTPVKVMLSKIGTCGGVASCPTLVRHTLTVGNTLCCNEGFVKRGFTRRSWACTLPRDVLGRRSRKQHGVIWGTVLATIRHPDQHAPVLR